MSRNNLASTLLVLIFYFIPNIAFAQATAGSALEFYGTNPLGRPGIVKIPRTGVLSSIGSAPFTIEWFMKSIPEKNNSATCVAGAENWANGNIIIDATQIQGVPDKGGFGVSMAGGVISFGVEDTNQKHTICGNTQINDGNWHHVAVTRIATSGLMSIFVDGQLDFQFFGPSGDISYNISRVPDNPLDPYIVIGGRKTDPNQQYAAFAGTLEELRISSIKQYGFSYTVPTTPFLPDNNTTVLYHFDDCIDTDLNDTSANAIHAKIEAIPDPASPVRVGSTAPFTNGAAPLGCITPTPPLLCPKRPTGDANCDGQTNLSDFEIWRKEFNGDTDTIEADFGNNGKVDLTDFEIWRKGFIGEI